MDFKRIMDAHPRDHAPITLAELYTPWGEKLDSRQVLQEHPRPQCKRSSIVMLNGVWDYAFINAPDAEEIWKTASCPDTFDGSILVPFSPEALLSGVGRQLKPDELLWYHRSFECPEYPEEGHVLLHFDAVDYCCVCYVNGHRVGAHVGGYIPFTFDITYALRAGSNTISLCVYDPSDEGVQPRGKQMLKRGEIWYTAQSGIWESVWLEVVPASYLVEFLLESDVALSSLLVAGQIYVGECGSEDVFRVVVKDDQGRVLVEASAELEPAEAEGQTVRSVLLTLPIDNPHLWSPDDPYLYPLEFHYGNDQVESYCAFRTISMESDDRGYRRFCLNGKPLFLKGVLDQGYWPDGLLTPPSDDALIFDIQAMKDLGFNMMRKHIKIENARWYYHCDRLGMLVWQDMVFGGSPLNSWHISYKPTFFRFTWGRFRDDILSHQKGLSSNNRAYQEEWVRTCQETIKYLRNHPSVVTWVLFNEGWGQFSAAKATEMVRKLDPTRAIDSVSGWFDQRCGDFLSVHNYFRPLEVYRDRGTPDGTKRAFVISEFGGFSYFLPEHSVLSQPYGYGYADELTDFQSEVRKALNTVDGLEVKGLAGYVYTQLSDVEEETNGLLTYDRRVNKMDAAAASQATDGREARAFWKLSEKKAANS